MNIKAYLYDAKGSDETIELDKIDIRKLDGKKLLWVNVLRRDEEAIRLVVGQLGLEHVPVRSIAAESSRPKIENHGDFFRFCVDSVSLKDSGSPERTQIDFVVSKNVVVTVHEGDVDYFDKFRKREKGETRFGELDAESFVATLLDLHIVSYFQALEHIQKRVDKLDTKVLKKDIETDAFLNEMVQLRGDVSKLRRWLLPHRDVLYALSRDDFQQIAESDSRDQYRHLNGHFDNAVDAVENARETVLSVFELYATKSAQQTNDLIRVLTFFTLLMGTLAVIAGVFGMNYQLTYFEAEEGFWFTVIGMLLITLVFSGIARWKKWI